MVFKGHIEKHNYWEGKHLSEEHKKKLSEVRKGTHPTKETIKKLSEQRKGKNNSFYGKHHTEESKKKMSEANSGKNHPFYGKHLTKEHKNKLSESKLGEKNPFYGKHHTKASKQKMSLFHAGRPGYWNGKCRTNETKNKMSEAHLGEKNHFYGKHHNEETRNNISFARTDWEFYDEHGCLKCNYPYNDCFTKEFKDKICALYDNKCVVTGMTNEEHKVKYGRALHIHHWTYDKDETDPFYFVPVTNEINLMANSNKSEWIEMFNGIAEDKYCEMMR